MKISRILKILIKDLKIGPRSPILLFAIAMPFLITFLVRIVFGSLFEPTSRLGIVDFGDSMIVKQAQNFDGIEVALLDNVEDLKKKVELNDFDAGFVLIEDFDELIQLDEKPKLEFFVSGESLASDRIILSVLTIDLIRQVEGLEGLVDVEIISLGEEYLPLSERLIPLILFYALFIAGVFVPAMSIVEERERKTINAMLATPVRLSEIMIAKAMLGFILAGLMSLVTLALNNAFGSELFALLLALLVSITMILEFSLIFATISKDAKSLFTLIKGLGFVLFAPAIFYIWPDLPQWIAKIFPTYWMIEPIYKVGVGGGNFNDIKFDLLIAVLICIALIPIISFLSKRMGKQLAL